MFDLRRDATFGLELDFYGFLRKNCSVTAVQRPKRICRLESRDARKKLQRRKEPYWRQIHRGLFVGYYCGQKSGVWFVRRYEDGRNHITRLALADDDVDADGTYVLSFGDAVKQAVTLGDQPVSIHSSTGRLTVKQAVDAYMDDYATRGKAESATWAIYRRHILPPFAGRQVKSLTREELRAWHRCLLNDEVHRLPAKGGKKGKVNRPRGKATANRILTMFKAVLNFAFHEGLIDDDKAWRAVKPFPNVENPHIRYLDESECRRLVNACDEDFRVLVRAALLTGCRYGELCRMPVGTYNVDAGTVSILQSKSGKRRHVALNDEGIAVFDEATHGKRPIDLIFTRDDGTPWGHAHQQRRMTEASARAGISPRVRFHELRHTFASLLAMNATELQVIAEALGHADTRITQRHYAHLAPSYVNDQVRAKLPRFGFDQSNVRRIGTRPS